LQIVFRIEPKLCLLIATSVIESTFSLIGGLAIQGAARSADTGPERHMPTARNGLVSGA
jgi:hypothetical protein